MALYNIRHRTAYIYSHQVTVSQHSAHIRPMSNGVQTCQSFQLKISPENSEMRILEDYFGNITHLFSINEPHSELIMETESEVETFATAPDLNLVTMTCGDWQALNQNSTDVETITNSEFRFPTPITASFPELEVFAAEQLPTDQALGPAILHFLDTFKDSFKFDPRATEHSTPIADVLKNRSGVCQDFAHLMIAAFRQRGIPARYVSGYILSHPPPGKPRLEGSDASHAWVSVFLPELGWVDIDPTNRLVCSDEHVTVAHGRDYSEVSMLKGAVMGGGSHTVEVGVTMMPI